MALEIARKPSIGRRWLAIAVLVGIGSFAFSAAWLQSGQIPEGGDPIGEARVVALLTLGATTVAAAVSLAAVVLTLGVQREQEQLQRWAEFQAQVLSESFDWIDGVLSRLGEVVGAIQEWGYAVESERAHKLANATEVLQEFYDSGQRLGEMERLELLVEDESVRRALREADGALRGFNEIAAGDPTTRDVRVEDASGEQWLLYSKLTGARDHIRDVYATAVHSAFSKH